MRRDARPLVPALLTAALVAACAFEWRNAQPAGALARADSPPGSLYAGWRVFQDRCARCHGPAGAGGTDAPDLLASVRTMGPRRFVAAVLQRYEWDLPPSADDAEHEARLDRVLGRRDGALTMPDWQGEPRVTAHIADLYAYLSARADGTQGPGRPAR